MELSQLIDLARGNQKADLVIKNAQVVNVISGEIHKADVGIANGIFLGFGDYKGHREIDAKGRYMAPGLVEGHIHIESTLLIPPRFAKALGHRGTSAVVCDPHEIANVLGRPGVEYMLDSARNLPVAIYFMVPSCVPATHLENSGAEFTAEDIKYFLEKYPEQMLGLAEMMNFPGVLFKDPKIMAELGASADKIIDGHAPLLSGRDLNAYVLAGPGSDHECSRPVEALEKLRAGLHLMLREGSLERNMEDLLPVINDFNAQNISLVTDDRNIKDLQDNGHLDYAIRRAIALGVNPVRAIQMASINTARYFGLRRHGAIAPGFRADFSLLEDLENFAVQEVYLQGLPINEYDFEPGQTSLPGNSMNIQEEISSSWFEIPLGKGRIRVMVSRPGLLITENKLLEPTMQAGQAVADPERDLCKIAVIERHLGTGSRSVGFVQGLGLEKGALAGTVAHDSHNLIVAGMNDADMVRAAQEAVRMGGGFVAVLDGRVQGKVPLPVAGLMSNKGLDQVAQEVYDLDQATQTLGCTHNPFMRISFLALPVIPSLKLTDKGLVDVEKFEFTSLWEK